VQNSGKKVVHCCLIAFGLLWMAGTQAVRADGTLTKRLESYYGSQHSYPIRVCLPARSGASRRPGVLLIHGGGWMGGDLNGMSGWCDFFAQRGIVAATFDYRLATQLDESTRWPAQLEDTMEALRWLRNRASEFHLDPKHICAYGESAGGHIALWLGIADSNISCVVDAFGPTDLTRLGPKFARAFDALFGSSRNPKKLRAASPVFNLSSQMPPVMTIQGENDTLVPPEQANLLIDALHNRRLVVTAISYRGSHQWKGIGAKARALIFNRIAGFINSASPGPAAIRHARK
jgi:acetyl esterase/lipase